MLLKNVNETLDESPTPQHEWRSLRTVLEVELLARLLGISHTSVHRYISNRRITPDRIADCLHMLASVVGDLAGAFNDIGVRRWFDRPRAHLNSKTPAQELGVKWTPEDEGPRRVRELARSLVLPPIT